ncbi:MAG TPA: LamG-like jellyroll fold domain-containing protein [Candidatus Dormibacteraeota bacterium]
MFLVSLLFAALPQVRVLPAFASSYSSTVLGDSPVAYWRLGEASGTTMADASGTGNAGTYHGGYTLGQTGIIAGDSDTAVTFNGSNGYASVPNATSLSMTGAFSLEAWATFSSLTTNQLLINKGDGASAPGTAYQLYYYAGLNQGVRFTDVFGGTGYEAFDPTPLVTGRWYYLVGTRSSDGWLSMYVNGSLVGRSRDPGGAFNNVASGVGVSGAGGNGTWPFNGTLDEAAIYNVALSATQVAAHWQASGNPPGAPTGVAATTGVNRATISWSAPASSGSSAITSYTVTPHTGSLTGRPATVTGTSATISGLSAGASYTFTVVATNGMGSGPTSSPSSGTTPSGITLGYGGKVTGDGPAGYWRLGEASGSTAYDSSGGGNNGLYMTGTTLGQGGALLNDPDAATLFNGTGGYVRVPNSTSLDITGAISLEVWAQFNDLGTNQLLINKGDGVSPSGTSYQMYYLTGSNPGVHFQITFNGTTYEAAQPTAPIVGRWYDFVGTRTASGALTLYVDGSAVGTGQDAGGAFSSVSSGVGIGGAGGNGVSPFNGTLDEVAIYPSALTATQVLAHFNAGAPVGGSLTPAQSAGGGINLCLPCLVSGIERGIATPSPIDTGTGNFWHTFSDFNLPGRSYPLALTRTYNSQSAATNGPLGYGWQFNHAMSLSQSGSTATITQENGSQATFSQSGSAWSPSAPRFIATLTHNGDGTWTFVRQNRDTYGFNASGQLTSAKDLNGYTTTFTYSAGNLSSVTDPAGRALTIGWTGSHLTSVTDANVTPARVVQYQYNDGAGNLTDVIDVNAGHSQFAYNTSHRMTVMKDPKCYATTGCPGVQNSYDGGGRVQWQKDQLNRQTSFAYGANQTTVTDPKGNQRLDAYTQGLRTATTKGYGTAQAATWHYAYDLSTLALIAVTDPNGNTTTYTVDGSGNPLTVTDPLGRQTINTYNSLNEMLTSKDPNGVTTTNVYNANGNLTSVSRPLTGTLQVQTTTYAYTDSSHPGDVTSMVDPDNKTRTYTYDAYGNRASTTDPLGDKATRVFNADGWITSSVSPKGNVVGCGCQSTFTTTYAHDPFGDVTMVTDPLSHQTIRHYDADQNMDWFQDGNGNRTAYVYDLANEQTQMQRPDTTTLTTDYFTDGTVQDQKDGKNNAIVTYGYDALARVTSTTDALSNVTAYTYDGAGNRLTQEDPGGNCAGTPKTGCTSFTYDVANQLKAINYSDGVTPNVTNILYDGDGQRTSMTDGTGTSSWAWDSLHRLTSYTNGAGAQVQYGYNLRSLVTTLTYPGSLNVTRGYDDAGRFTSVLDWRSNTTAFGYDVNSNLTTETLPSGTGVVDTFTFDAADRLLAISSVKAGVLSLFGATYSRDNANQLTSDSSAPATGSRYQYNSLNQLCYAGASNSNACSLPPPAATAYAYDPADNLTQAASTQQVFNAADQLCWTGTTAGVCSAPPPGATTYAYDTRGNRITVTPAAGAATNLSYDQANRLTAYSTSSTYAYNGDGLRMSKTVSGATSQFLWDAAPTLPILLSDGATAYVYGPGGLPLEQINGSTVLWLHHDQIGSTRLVTDAGGASQATYTFDAYGKITASTGLVLSPFLFTGQYQDAESGLYYLRARYYDASTGQFLSRDTVVSTTRQPYSYVADNPLNAADPSGNCPWCLVGAVVGAVAGGGIDLAVQLHNNGGHFDQVNWGETAGWAVTGAFVGGTMGLGATMLAGAAAGGAFGVAGLEAASALGVGDAAVLWEEAAQGEGASMAGAGCSRGRAIYDVNRLTNTYGGDEYDWAKMTTRSLAGNSRYQVHSYMNLDTQQVVERKWKYQQ